MKIPGWLIVVALALAGFILWQGYGCEQRKRGDLEQQVQEAKERVRVRDSVIVVLMQEATKADTVYLTKLAPRLDSAIAAVKRDPSPANVGELVESCSVVRLDCEQRIAGRNRIIEQQRDNLTDKDKQIRALEKQVAGPWVDCVGGGTLSNAGVGLGVGCGVRLTRIGRALGF